MIRAWLCSRGWHRLRVTAAPTFYDCRDCKTPVHAMKRRRELTGVAEHWSREHGVS